MSHAVNSTLFQDRESGPIIVDIGPKNTGWWIGGESARRVRFLASGFFLSLLCLSAKDGGEETFFLLLLVGSFPTARLLALLVELDAVAVENKAFPPPSFVDRGL